MLQKPGAVVAINGDVSDVRVRGIQDAVPVRHHTEARMIKFLDVHEVDRTLLHEVVKTVYERFLVTPGVTVLGVHIEGIGHGRIDADSKILYQHHIHVRQPLYQDFCQIGAVPDVIVRLLKLCSLRFK